MDTQTVEYNLKGLADFIDQRRQQALTVGVSAGNENEATALLVPDGLKLLPTKPILDAFRNRPERREGTTILTTLESFIRWTNRHRADNSVIFAIDEMAKPSLTVVIDHDDAGPENGHISPPEGDTDGAVNGAERAWHGKHRGVYPFPLSREWEAWMKVDKVPLSITEFAEFFEVRIGDVLPPPMAQLADGTMVSAITDKELLKLIATQNKRLGTPSEIAQLMDGISINVEATSKARINRDTGEHFIEFSESNGTGVDRVKPPSLFLIDIPVFRGQQPTSTIAVHLRYRTGGGKLTWIMEVHQPDRIFETEFCLALERVAAETTITPLRGTAPAAR